MGIAEPSSIYNLALGLLHREAPEAPFMVMTAYIDESGTHGQESPVVIVGGFGATSAQWASYERGLKRLFNEYDITIFHSRKFRGCKGDFKGWLLKRKAQFHSQFLKVADENFGFGFAAVLKASDYKNVYRAGELPRTARARPDTNTGFAFA